jgi:hypothetical protein
MLTSRGELPGTSRLRVASRIEAASKMALHEQQVLTKFSREKWLRSCRRRLRICGKMSGKWSNLKTLLIIA